jgi:1,4-dihydroxy-2-naphthoyl-CoA hydrolase
MIWKQIFTVEGLNILSENTLVQHLGIEFTEFGDDYISARMPVDNRTVQPMRLLHGGASVVLAETLGSSAGMLCLEDLSLQSVVGVEVNANHLRSVRKGWVKGTCSPVRIGRSLQVWNIDIRDEQGRLCCVSRLTLAVVNNI